MLSKPSPIPESLPTNPSKPQQTTLKSTFIKKFPSCRIFTPTDIPKQYIFETIMLIAVLERKHNRLHEQQYQQQQQKQQQQHQQGDGGNGSGLNWEEKLMKVFDQIKGEVVGKAECSEQEWSTFCGRIVNCVKFIQTADLLVKDFQQLIYFSVLSICQKKQQKTLVFWRSQAEYTQQDLKNFAQKFHEQIHYLDFDKTKAVTQQFMNCTNTDAIYLLKFKDRFYCCSMVETVGTGDNVGGKVGHKLGVKASMKILGSGEMPAASVEEIFTKKNYLDDSLSSSQGSIRSSNRSVQSQLLYQTPKKSQPSQLYPQLQTQPNSQPKPMTKTSTLPTLPTVPSTQPIPATISQQPQPTLQHTSSIRDSQVVTTQRSLSTPSRSISDDSILRITMVKCGKCCETFSEIDCLYWNYLYYCYKCIVDVQVDTSDIPATRIGKFLRLRNITTTWNYQTRCKECHSLTVIKRYNPEKKNKFYQCQLCKKVICVPHKGNIYNCLCFCPNCKTPTIYVQKIKTNICQNCRAMFCFKCKKKGYNFCKCVCTQCLSSAENQGSGQKSHECEPACHSCNNKPTRLRICKCGMFVCYGCYYAALEKWKVGVVFPCNQGEYA